MRRHRCRGPVWCSKIRSRSKPHAQRHSVAHWFSQSRLTTVALYSPLPSSAPRSSRLSVSLPRCSRSSVNFFVRHEHPNNSRHLVRQRYPHRHRWLAQQHPSQPSARSGHWMDMPLYNDAVGTNNQQSPQRSLSHFSRRPEPLLAACRVLSRHKPEPSCKIAPSAECLRGRREGNQSRSDQRPNSCDRHQPARHLILFGAPTDLGVELGDLIVEADLRLDQNQQRCPSFLRQATCRILYDRTQACCVCCPLGNHLPKFRQVAAKHIDRLSALTDQ